MSKNRKAVATITALFYEDGDANLKFDVAKDIKVPTTAHTQVIALAKVLNDLMASLMESPGILTVNELIALAVDNEGADFE